MRQLLVYSMIILLFPRLQVEHSVCKLLRVVLPPLDHGEMWSICKVTDGSLFVVISLDWNVAILY